MEPVFTFEKHKSQPEISLAAYGKSKHIELGKLVLSTKIVYLDTKFWIILRDVALGRNDNKAAHELYKLCLRLRDLGKCIFPLSDSIFMEVLKQTDETTFKTTIRLIDQLSNGVSLINTRDRMGLEIVQFMDEKSGKPTHKCDELVWTKLTYVLGFMTPSNPNFDENTNLVIQKAFFDQMWSMSLEEFLNVGDPTKRTSRPVEKSISEKLNELKITHSGECKSFQHMFLNEIAGILDVAREDFGTRRRR